MYSVCIYVYIHTRQAMNKLPGAGDCIGSKEAIAVRKRKEHYDYHYLYYYCV